MEKQFLPRWVLLDDIDGTLLFENRIQLTKLQPEVLLKVTAK